MNVQTIAGQCAAQLAPRPFDAYAAYQAERTYSRRIEGYLSRALILLSMECGRHEMRGEDASVLRAFIKDAGQ